MELKEGMYVRTKNGLIAKCISVDNYTKKHIFDDNVSWEYEYYEEVSFDSWEEFVSENLKKYSFELIDLIEEGDYVNGYKVLDVTEQYIKLNNPKLNYNCIEFERIFKNKYSCISIEDIVTKEQFNLVKYHKKRAE